MFVSLPLGGALWLNGSCTSIPPHPSWRRPARLQLQHHGRDRGGSDCQPLGTSAGLGFPSTRHLNWAAGHQLLLYSPPCCDRKPPVSPPARQGCSYFLDTNTTEFWSVWGGPVRFWEQDSGSRWTITAVALLTAARCIIFWGDSSASAWTKLNRSNVMLCMWTPRFRLLFVFPGSVCLLGDTGKQQQSHWMRWFSAQQHKWPGVGRIDGLDDESAFEGSRLR